MKMSPNQPNRKDAFTLLEVLVAFSLLSIMLITILQTQSETVYFARKTGKLEIARNVVFEELLASERLFPNSSSLTENGVFSDDHPLAGDEWYKKIEVVELLGFLKVRKLTFGITWDNENSGRGSFESFIFAEAL